MISIRSDRQIPARLEGPTGSGAAERHARKLDLAVGLVAVGLALASKIPIALKSSLRGDDALVALMAKHVVEGCGIPVHLYAFPLQLGAVLNVYLLAPVYWIFGYDPSLLPLVTQVVTALLAALLYVLLCRYHGRFTALAGVACLTAAIPLVSLYLLWADHHDWGLVFLTWQTILFFRIYLDRSDRWRDLALFGAVSALAYRVSGATLVQTAVCVGLLLIDCRRRRAIRVGLVAGSLAGGAVAAFLALVGGWQAGRFLFLPRSPEAGNRLALAWESLALLPAHLTASFRVYAFSKIPWQGVFVDYFLFAGAVAALGLTLFSIARRGRSDAGSPGSRHDRFLVLSIVFFFLVYAYSPWSRGAPGNPEPAKYLLYTYPAFILLAAHRFRKLPLWIRGIVVAGIVLTLSFTYRIVRGEANPSRELPQAVEFLRSQGLTRVYAEYNLALPLMAYSGEEILAASLEGGVYLPWSEQVWSASRVAFAYHTGRRGWEEAKDLLDRAGVQYKTWELQDIKVFYDFDEDPLPGLSALSLQLSPVTGRAGTTPPPPRYFATKDCSVFPPAPLGRRTADSEPGAATGNP